ncbi:SWIM zinc finger family protein [Halorientalis brevis]|uniref:SWIM zinc finger family protein n=1 Tax=Halorientalis brevis TaxID=1126241 RepID=A0ABD6CAH2_9EURY|nr:SWIM zinc finger family protein [Halorientalis brevis]
MSQVRSPKVALAPDLRKLDERAVRAWTEPMAVVPLGGGVYRVETHEDHSYSVDLPGQRCTCPDHQYRGVQCKHLRRVAIEVTQELVPPPGKEVADCAVCATESFVPELSDPPLCDDCRLEPGDIVRDRETGEADLGEASENASGERSEPRAGDRLVVTRVTPERADEYVVEAVGQTIADFATNEGYPAEDLVVEVVYLGDAARRDDPRTYAFPYSRLDHSEDAALLD